MLSFTQGRPSIAIDPGQISATGSIPTQPLTGIKMFIVNEIKHIFIVLVLPYTTYYT
jgi:hypothetical protein